MEQRFLLDVEFGASLIRRYSLLHLERDEVGAQTTSLKRFFSGADTH